MKKLSIVHGRPVLSRGEITKLNFITQLIEMKINYAEFNIGVNENGR